MAFYSFQVFVVLSNILFSVAQSPSYNGLAITPAMGWNTYNAFACKVNEDLLVSTAQKIIDYGLKDLGYEYINLDGCWNVGRSEDGTLVPDPAKFPNGMKHVADQVHKKGFKYGMHSDAGFYTCGGSAGSLGHEVQDAETFASWGVDYLKYDNCYNGGQAGNQMLSYTRYYNMTQALNMTGRPILYSLCNWGEDSPWNWAATMSNSYRMSGDICDSFDRPDPRCPCTGDEDYNCPLPGFHCSMMNILNKIASIQSKTQSGAQNDMDILEVGNGGMTDDEYQLHFSMWAMNSSPLLIGTDVRKMTPNTLSIHSNPAVIAVNQDPNVAAAVRHWRYYVDDTDQYGQGEISMWTRTMNNSDVVVAFVNAGNMRRDMNTTLAEIFVDDGGALSSEAMLGYDVYDLWANRMDNVTSSAILNGTSGVVDANSTMRYNSTALSYADGLAMNATALFGAMKTSVAPMGTLTATVPRHGVGLYRLRAQPGMGVKDEL